jgi:hypothetical protein
MGFLLGAFGKLAAGRRVRALQAQMMRIQSRARRATRDVADMSKMLDRQEKMALNSLSMTSMASVNMAKGSLMSSIFGSGVGAGLMSKINGGETLNQDENNQYSTLMSQFNQQVSNMTSMNEMNVSMQKQYIQDYFEMLRETQLEPLKDEEELLQTEKDSLESQLQIANNDYEACKKMEQADAKNLAPSYTAG